MVVALNQAPLEGTWEPVEARLPEMEEAERPNFQTWQYIYALINFYLIFQIANPAGHILQLLTHPGIPYLFFKLSFERQDKMRILCLHGMGTNTEIFATQTGEP